jgi:hypothetical protein
MPVKSDEFRKIALSFPEAIESSHMNHPDFRVGGKVFATLAYPTREFGMVKLTPEQQHDWVHDEPDTFAPVKGGWGLKGSTSVRLKTATKTALRRAMEAAWRNAASRTKSSGRTSR